MEVDPKSIQKIEKLEKEIYSQGFQSDTSSRSEFSHPENGVVKDWQHENNLKMLALREDKPRMSLFKKIFIFSVVFFLLCAAIAVYAIYHGFDIISADKVDVTFNGPVQAAAGSEVDSVITVTNENNIALQNAVLFIDYPAGTKQAGNVVDDLLHEKYTLGDIPIGGSVNQTIKMIFFGAEHSTQAVAVKLEYDVKNSNAPFEKDKSYSVLLTSSPVSINVTAPGEAATNQDIQFTVNVISNSSSPLTNLFLKGDYPFGFQFVSATPTPMVNSTSLWSLGTLNPGEKRVFTLHGRVAGEEGDERVFHFTVGSGNGTSSSITTQFLSVANTIDLHKPPLAVDVDLNNTPIAQVSTTLPGTVSRGIVHVTNNLTTQILNGTVQLVFGGNALDVLTPNGDEGLYRAPSETIFWDKSSAPELAVINPGQTIDLNFSFSSLPDASLRGIKNGSIQLFAGVSGQAITQSNGNQSISSSISGSLKIQPSFAVVPRIVYSTGAFKNTGSIPPKAETKTTYTVIWTVTSSTDAMTGIEVHGTLPSYVKWLGATSPSTESITWNSEQDEIVWHVGDIPAGLAGYPAKEVSFQVELDPTTSQIGTIPIVVDTIHFSAMDAFTNNLVANSTAPLTTNLSTDPKFQNQSGIVVK